MAGKQNAVGKVAQELCKNFQNTSTLALARMLYNEFPMHLKSVESARSLIRTYRGELTQTSANINPARITKRKLPAEKNPYKMPDSYELKKERFHIPKSIKKLLILSDIHIPYHSIEAVESAINYGLEQGVDGVYLNGDILDFYQLSFHEKDPRKISIKDELDAGREFLGFLRHTFDCPIYFIPGNHEVRLQRFLRVKAPELLGNEEFELKSLLRCGEHRIEYLEHFSKVYFGKLLIEHGDKLRGAGGVNPARTLLLKFKRPTICGHFHRTTSANHNVYDDTHMMAWSTGCLCELEPDYMPVNEWNHGAAIVERLSDDGHYGKVY